MRNWGILISAFYAFILLVFIAPGAVFLAGPDYSDFEHIKLFYTTWLFWIVVIVVLAGQIILLFLAVDTSRKRLKPRAHILLSCTVAAMFFTLLTVAAFGSLSAGLYGDEAFGPIALALIFSVLLWLLWGIVFYLFSRNSSGKITRLTSWLLTGSVLELLIAVPCHVIVRRREDCSAPVVTSFGIATGIAIMLLSFGPSVLFLYRKRLDAYATRRARLQ
jgi:hypothetical protein